MVMLPQPPNVLLFLKYGDIIISKTGQEGSTADWRWATTNQSYRGVVRLWHLVGWWEFRIPGLSDAHLTKHLGRKKTQTYTFEIIDVLNPLLDCIFIITLIQRDDASFENVNVSHKFNQKDINSWPTYKVSPELLITDNNNSVIAVYLYACMGVFPRKRKILLCPMQKTRQLYMMYLGSKLL